MAGMVASRTRRRTVVGSLGPVLALLLAALAACAGSSAPSEPTATVVRGDVSRTVTADGALSGVTPGAGSVLVVPFGAKRLRAVTHHDVTRDDIDRAASIITTTLT